MSTTLLFRMPGDRQVNKQAIRYKYS